MASLVPSSSTCRDYTTLSSPISKENHTATKSHLIAGPMDIHIDNDSRTIYIVIKDLLSKCIQVWSHEMVLIRKIGEDVLQDPHCLTLCNGSVYVSECYPSRVSQFTPDGKLICSNDEVNQPVGMASENGEIFVAEPDFNRICIFDNDLKEKRKIGESHLRECHCIRVHKGTVYSLELKFNLIAMLAINGDLKAWISTNRNSDPMKNAISFCIDQFGNFLIADYYHHYIKIVDKDGILIGVVSLIGFDCLLPRAITTDDFDQMFVVCRSGRHPLIVM